MRYYFKGLAVNTNFAATDIDTQLPPRAFKLADLISEISVIAFKTQIKPTAFHLHAPNICYRTRSEKQEMKKKQYRRERSYTNS